MRSSIASFSDSRGSLGVRGARLVKGPLRIPPFAGFLADFSAAEVTWKDRIKIRQIDRKRTIMEPYYTGKKLTILTTTSGIY